MAWPAAIARKVPPKKSAPPKGRKEVAGPYRSQSSVESIRNQSRPSEHRTVDATPAIPHVTIHPSGKVTVTAPPSVSAPERRAAARSTRAHTKAHTLERRQNTRQRRRQRKSELPPSTQPAVFRGEKTVGTPTIRELRKSAKALPPKLVHKDGRVITPKVMKAAKGLKQARKIVSKAGGVPAGMTHDEAETLRDSRASHKRHPALPIPVGMAQVKQESGFDSGANSNADAHGRTQFIPGTAATYGVEYGTGRPEEKSQVEGQYKYMEDLINQNGGNVTAALNDYLGVGGTAPSDYSSNILAMSKEFKGVGKPPLKPGQKAKVKKLTKQAKAAGLKVRPESPEQQKVNYLKVFGKNVAQQLKLVKAGKFDSGPGSLVVGDSDVSTGHEPEIAARLKILSAKIGKPIYIISGHRTPEHSVEVGGFADDPHTQSNAADIGIGSALRDSAGEISEAEYNSVGLHRPYYPESSAEINHVELLNGGTPTTGAGGGTASVTSGGGSVGSSGGTTSSSSSSSSGGTTAQGKAAAKKKAGLSAYQNAKRTLRQIHADNVGGQPHGHTASEDGLSSLEKKYGKAAV